MHSSRMRSVLRLTVSRRGVGEGGMDTPPPGHPPCEQTDAHESITFPILRMWSVKVTNISPFYSWNQHQMTIHKVDFQHEGSSPVPPGGEEYD